MVLVQVPPLAKTLAFPAPSLTLSNRYSLLPLPMSNCKPLGRAINRESKVEIAFLQQAACNVMVLLLEQNIVQSKVRCVPERRVQNTVLALRQLGSLFWYIHQYIVEATLARGR